MEPRGIEPRSRDSQSGASTRVSGGLISASAAITRSLREGPTCSIFSRFHPCRSQVSASSKSVVVMLSSIARGPRSLIRPRERSYARQTLWCMLFTRLACSWTRSNQTSHARSNPVRPRVIKDQAMIAHPFRMQQQFASAHETSSQFGEMLNHNTAKLTATASSLMPHT